MKKQKFVISDLSAEVLSFLLFVGISIGIIYLALTGHIFLAILLLILLSA